MKKVNLFSFILLSVLLFSCGNKQVKDAQPQLSSLNIELQETALSTKLKDIDLTRLPRLTPEEYDRMQLARVKNLEGYDLSDLTMGEILFANEQGKILTIKVITDGEITEYLLSYDKNGNLLDNLLVAYEDMVEYYSEVSSKINSNKIIVQTVNFTYGDEDGSNAEKSDTAFTNYQITPELRIVND